MGFDIERERRAWTVAFAEQWSRRLQSMAGEITARGGCKCSPAGSNNEFAHRDPDCPVLIHLRLARLMEEEAANA